MTAPTTLTPAQVAAVYRAAADLLDIRGWVQGRPEGDNGELCPTAAINEADGRNLRDSKADLMDPFAAWLVANRADQVREAFLVTGYGPADSDFVRLMSSEFRNDDGLRVVQRWNDYRHNESVGVDRGPSRAKDEVTAALRECADSLTV